MEAELGFWLALHRIDGVGPRRLKRLLEHYGSPKRAWNAPAHHAAGVCGGSVKLAAGIRRAHELVDPAAEPAKLEKSGTRILFGKDPSYPTRLTRLEDPPSALFYRGQLPAWDRVIAIVGTRRATPYGLFQAHKTAQCLAASGILILSGLARGIDTAAHRGAIAAGGSTAAILGSSVDVVWPPQNESLANAMVQSGMALISEYPPHTDPAPWRFPARNRLVAALAQALVVVEAPSRSGALLTADLAAEVGTEVYVIPGPVNGGTFAGAHGLLRDGARLIRDAADLLDDLGWNQASSANQDAAGAVLTGDALSVEDRAILSALSSQGLGPEELARVSGIVTSTLLAALSRLELNGQVVRTAGPTYYRQH